jgi:hypothetical protein
VPLCGASVAQLVDLTGAEKVTDAGIAGLAKCSRLRSANLTWVGRLSDIGVCALAEVTAGLRALGSLVQELCGLGVGFGNSTCLDDSSSGIFTETNMTALSYLTCSIGNSGHIWRQQLGSAGRCRRGSLLKPIRHNCSI